MPTLADLFGTVPQDRLALFEDDTVKYESVKELLSFNNEDVSTAVGVAPTSVRYDAKMPAQLQERLKEWATLLNLVATHFDGDAKKTALWFTMPNPLLGNIAPRIMIRHGRFKKLLRFVLNALAENRR